MTKSVSTKTWVKRIGWTGFFFFLFKGIVWLFLIIFGGFKMF